jgi:molybdopterin synthase sulfur carrier subunit
MRVKVKLYATLRLELGISDLAIEFDQPITMMQLLEKIQQKVQADIISELIEDGIIIAGTILLIDGKNVLHAQKLETLIPDNCIVSIFPPVGGG